MIPTLFSLFALFLGTSLMVAGSGLLGTSISLQADGLGFPAPVTGAVMAAYFAGFVFGTFVCPKIVIRVGHIRAFSAFAACAAAAVLLHPLVPDPGFWALLRFVTGTSLVGLYMVIESWLNERSANEIRGRVFALYQLISLTSIALGQYLILVEPDVAASPFLIAGALFSLGLVPVVLTRIKEPTPITSVTLDLKGLWAIAPLGVAGTFVVALCNGAFFALGPVFAQHTGLSTTQIATFMSVSLLGGVALQLPIGWYSDRHDRRTIILWVSVAAAVAASIAWLAREQHPVVLFAAMFIYGGATFSLYSLCVAHANDHPQATNFVATASGMLLVYGIGATLGPVAVGTMMQYLGAGAFLLFLIAMHATLSVLDVVYIRRRPAPPVEAQEPFVILTRTSQSALEAVAPVPSAPASDESAGSGEPLPSVIEGVIEDRDDQQGQHG